MARSGGARKLFVCLVLILGVFFCPALIASTNVSGTITTDTTWNLAGSPYIIVGNLTVSTRVTLTIPAGVEVKNDSSNPGYSLRVYGTLNANVATFSGNSQNIYINSGGRVDLTNCTVTAGYYSSITYENGSSGTLDDVRGSNGWQLYIYSSGVSVINGLKSEYLDVSATVTLPTGIELGSLSLSAPVTVTNSTISGNLAISASATVTGCTIGAITLSASYPTYHERRNTYAA
jgi:hypothetical protein